MSMRVLAASVFIVIVLNATGASASERDCLPPKPDQRKVTYCESVKIGHEPFDTNGSTYTVSFESKFFDGLMRTKTKKGYAFRKGYQAVTNYPESFVIAVEMFSFRAVLNRPADAAPGIPHHPPREQKPRELVLRWLNQSGAVLGETKISLEEVVEGWPEHDSPTVWYRATVGQVNQPLDAFAEIVLLGEGESPLATVRGRL